MSSPELPDVIVKNCKLRAVLPQPLTPEEAEFVAALPASALTGQPQCLEKSGPCAITAAIIDFFYCLCSPEDIDGKPDIVAVCPNYLCEYHKNCHRKHKTKPAPRKPDPKEDYNEEYYPPIIELDENREFFSINVATYQRYSGPDGTGYRLVEHPNISEYSRPVPLCSSVGKQKK